jgi:hypothetical protein
MKCDNCGQPITGPAIEHEEERTFYPRDAYQYDAPVLSWFCSEKCKAEYLDDEDYPVDLQMQKHLS